jgi:hypothetical protein
VKLKRLQSVIATGLGLAVAVLTFRRLGPSWAEDRCLDQGGAVRRTERLCETAAGTFAPLQHDRNAAAWAFDLALAALGGALAFAAAVLALHALRRLASRPSA